jgi:hypothetical protein
MRARAAFNGVNGGRGIDCQNAQALITLLALDGFTDNTRAFQRRVEAIALQAAQMQQNVLHAVVGDDEAVAPADVEPFDQTADLMIRTFRSGWFFAVSLSPF